MLVTATAVTGLVTMLWLLRRGIDGFVANSTASLFTLFYIPFLGSFVSLLLAEDGHGGRDGVKGIVTFIVVTIASDIGGYIAGVLFGKHPMAPVISPKKSWEGFAGSVVGCVLAGVLLVALYLDAAWWIGVLLGLIAVVMATLGDLVESVMKRDLGIKDMSPGDPRPRRPDGPAGLAAGHHRPDLAAAALPGVLAAPAAAARGHVIPVQRALGRPVPVGALRTTPLGPIADSHRAARCQLPRRPCRSDQ